MCGTHSDKIRQWLVGEAGNVRSKAIYQLIAAAWQ